MRQQTTRYVLWEPASEQRTDEDAGELEMTQLDLTEKMRLSEAAVRSYELGR